MGDYVPKWGVFSTQEDSISLQNKVKLDTKHWVREST